MVRYFTYKWNSLNLSWFITIKYCLAQTLHEKCFIKNYLISILRKDFFFLIKVKLLINQTKFQEGTRWFGKCWYYHDKLKYEFDVEFDIPVTYPATAPEIALPELDGKTAKVKYTVYTRDSEQSNYWNNYFCFAKCPYV